jgi:predicted membrane-bound spermidine synthase
MEFPLASKVYSQGQKLSQAAGIMYGADLLGAFLGSVVFSVGLLPPLGLAGSCWIVALLKAGSFGLVILSVIRRENARQM